MVSNPTWRQIKKAPDTLRKQESLAGCWQGDKPAPTNGNPRNDEPNHPAAVRGMTGIKFGRVVSNPTGMAMKRTLNRRTHENYLRIEGAKMMIRQVCDFLETCRPACNNGKKQKTGLDIGPHKDDNGELKWFEIKCTDEQIIDAIRRYTINSWNCSDFIHGVAEFSVSAEFDSKGKVTKLKFK